MSKAAVTARYQHPIARPVLQAAAGQQLGEHVEQDCRDEDADDLADGENRAHADDVPVNRRV